MRFSVFEIHRVPVPAQAAASCGWPTIDFADCYHGHSLRTDASAIQMARAMFEQPPAWARALMATRNHAVRWLGLKTPLRVQDGEQDAGNVGIFPLLSQTPAEVVLGLDDRHLDFRIWVRVQNTGGGTEVWSSTLVRFNGWTGRAYLFLVMPFHKLLARRMLARALQMPAP